MATKTKNTVRCRGVVAEGRQCKRHTSKNNELCGVCKGKKATNHLSANVSQMRKTKPRKTRAAKQARPKPYERISNALAETFDEILETFEGSWQKTWQAMAPFLASRNATTGRPYRGGNQLMLAAMAVRQGFKTPNWGTYKQWSEVKGQVKTGQKGTLGVYWKEMTKKDPNHPHDRSKDQKIRYCNTFWLFNLDQVELPEGHKAKHVYRPATPAGTAQAISEGCERAGVKVVHQPTFDSGLGAPTAAAFHIRDSDVINMPPRETFETDDQYTEALLHELVHWTGDTGRCERQKGKTFGDEKYAREELVAQLGVAIACASLGIEQGEKEMHNHAAYLSSWKQAAGDDPQILMKTAALASRAVQYLEKEGIMPKAANVPETLAA